MQRTKETECMDKITSFWLPTRCPSQPWISPGCRKRKQGTAMHGAAHKNRSSITVWSSPRCFSMLDLASGQVTSICMIFSGTTQTQTHTHTHWLDASGLPLSNTRPCWDRGRPVEGHHFTDLELQVPACSTNMEARPVNTNSPWSHCHTPSELWARPVRWPQTRQSYKPISRSRIPPHPGLCSRVVSVSYYSKKNHFQDTFWVLNLRHTNV